MRRLERLPPPDVRRGRPLPRGLRHPRRSLEPCRGLQHGCGVRPERDAPHEHPAGAGSQADGLHGPLPHHRQCPRRVADRRGGVDRLGRPGRPGLLAQLRVQRLAHLRRGGPRLAGVHERHHDPRRHRDPRVLLGPGLQPRGPPLPRRRPGRAGVRIAGRGAADRPGERPFRSVVCRFRRSRRRPGRQRPLGVRRLPHRTDRPAVAPRPRSRSSMATRRPPSPGGGSSCARPSRSSTTSGSWPVRNGRSSSDRGVQTSRHPSGASSPFGRQANAPGAK